MDEEWTPPTEAELKVLNLSKFLRAIASANMGCYFLPLYATKAGSADK